MNKTQNIFFVNNWAFWFCETNSNKSDCFCWWHILRKNYGNLKKTKKNTQLVLFLAFMTAWILWNAHFTNKKLYFPWRWFQLLWTNSKMESCQIFFFFSPPCFFNHIEIWNVCWLTELICISWWRALPHVPVICFRNPNYKLIFIFIFLMWKTICYY